MFNPTNLAKEVFGVLRSFDYTVNTFDFDGNRVYEPEEARRFFATPKNLTVSIHEEGENSVIKLFLSQSTNVSEIAGLISTMRTIASKFGVLFNVRKYEKELRPKDLSPNAGIEFENGVSIVSKGEEQESEDTTVKFDVVSNEISELVNNIKDMRKKRQQSKVKKMKNKKPLHEKKGAEMIALPALNVSVEVDAWNKFKNNSIDLYSAPESFSEDRFANPTAGMVLKLRAVADKVVADGLANMLARVATAIEHGSNSKLHMAIADRAIALAYDEYVAEPTREKIISDEEPEVSKDVEDDDLKEKRNAELINLPALKLDVEKDAWEDFKDGKLELSSPVDFNIELGKSVNRDAFFLRQIADVVKADAMSVMFARIADDLENGDRTPLKRHIAKVALAAAENNGQANLNENRLIVTESIREFGKWFDSLSTVSLFEMDISRLVNDPDPLNGSYEMAMEYADEQVMDNFSVDEFLHTSMAEYYMFGNPELTDEEKEISESDIMYMLKEDIRRDLEHAMEGYEYKSESGITNIAESFLAEVKEKMKADGWVITDEKVKEDNELRNEDVLLPKNQKDDLTRELRPHQDDKDEEEARRIVSLARPKTL